MALSAAEQLLIELINRARLDPLGEAQRYGIDLNEGLVAGTLEGGVRQALAPNALLHDAAEAHSVWMLEKDLFQHVGKDGSSPGDRMAAAGYVFAGAWRWGENIAWRGSTGSIDLEAAIVQQHRGLFLSPGHRLNILEGGVLEVGIAQVYGAFTASGTTYRATSMLTENFAGSGTSLFLTGVAYSDHDGDGFYSVGEADAGAVFTAQGDAAVTEAAGGYALPLSATGEVTVSVARFGAPAAAVSIDLAGRNAKLDMVGADTLLSSADLAVLEAGPVRTFRLLGSAPRSLQGSAADEALIGNAADNTLKGAAGRDTLNGGAGDDRLYGGTGADLIQGWHGGDLVYGGDQNDTVYAGAGDDTVSGGNGRDEVWLADGDDLFYDNAQGGAFGRDTVYAQGGADTIEGAAGDDMFFGGPGRDSIYARRGNDLVYGGDQDDVIYAGAGNDTVYSGKGRDLVYLMDGDDVYQDADQSSAYGRDKVFGGPGNDRMAGSGGADTLVGEAGNDLVYGGSQDDILLGGSGADTIYGGNGRDRAYLGAGNDRFHDNGQTGAFGADLVFGEAGNDTLQAGGGNDTLSGGADDDCFVFIGAAIGQDVVTDYVPGAEQIGLDEAIWGGGLSTAQVVEAFADDSGADLVLDFLNGNTITFVGLDSKAGIEAGLFFV